MQMMNYVFGKHINPQNVVVFTECEYNHMRILSSQIINSKQPNLGLTQESLRMVTARVLVVLSGSFTSQTETGPTLT